MWNKKKADEHEIDKICLYCEHAVILNNDSENVLCNSKGIVSCDYICKRFVYDPLKRTPAPKKKPDSNPLPDINI